MIRGTRRMNQVRRVNDWQTWGGGEAAAEASLEQITQLLMNQASKGAPTVEMPSRQSQHHIQQLLRETLALTQQAAEAHEVVIEAPQWSQPPPLPPPPPPQDHPHHPTTTKAATAAAETVAEEKKMGESPQPNPAHPADVIGLAAGAQENHGGREPTGGEPTHIVKARNILTQLIPFLVQEEARLAAQAANALDEWLAEHWGEPIVLLETQHKEKGPTSKLDPTEGEEPDTPDTIPWAPSTPPSHLQPATHPLTQHRTTHGGRELHQRGHRVPEGDYDSRRRRTHEGASSD